jgi:hypothetical protein
MTRVSEENARPGTRAWWGITHAPPGAIEGFSTQTSAAPGGTLELCVSTNPAARYRITVYRLGWYGKAGGRQIARLPGNMGLARPTPEPDAETGLVRADWAVTDVIAIPEDAVSGQHVAHLELVGGPHEGSVYLLPFVVHPPAGDTPAALVQIPVNTWQAYNHWGGKSLYTSNSTDNVAAVKASFDRPNTTWRHSNLNTKGPFHYDVPLIRWLERNGYDIAYQTNVDTHRRPWTLVGPRLLVTSGHDEYWTWEMRGAFDDALDRGVNLAVMGANTCYWQVRYEDAERTLVEYRGWKRDPEPNESLKTIKFRDLQPPRDERFLLGVQYDGGITHPTRLFDYEVDPACLDDPWAAGTGLEDLKSAVGLVGYEFDALTADDPQPQTVRFLTYDGELSNASCIRWSAPSGARVFAAGSLALPFALDDWTRGGTADPRIERLVRNAFDDMLG